MDLSTRERRHAVCLRELEINRRTAPDLYRDVLPVTRAGDDLRLGGDGPAVDWVLRMRRFDQEALFDRLARRGELTRGLMRDLADEILAFHSEAPPADEPDSATALGKVVADTTGCFRDHPEVFAAAQAESFERAVRRAHESACDLLDRRQKAGLVRRCHGDLHLRNIVLIEGRPLLFDAIEFDEAIATIDLLYDLAFLLMDLEQRDLRELANVVANRYLAGVEDLSGLALLPFFLALRAAVRAMVAVLGLPAQDDEARRRSTVEEARAYFAAARRFLEPPPPSLVAVGGLSGSGKSSLAALLAPDIGAPPGALHLRSDVLRKRLFGVEETAPLGPEAYRPEVSERVYRLIAERARAALAAGQAVVADAVYARPAERAAIEAVASSLKVPFRGLWLEAPPDALKARAEARQADASDADAAVVERQLDYDLGDISWARIDARPPLAEVAAAARARLEGARG